MNTAAADDLAAVYQDLHAHPELSFHETRIAKIVAERLRGLGYEVATEVGRTGVVGVLRNGSGPTALLRADMDALPVLEQTGLPYASTARGVDPEGNDVAVMHACGHDMHVTCLLGAARELVAARPTWSGTLILVFQPAEEVGAGARAMIEDGLFDRFGLPDIVLGQHVAPFPAGYLALRPGPAFAASDSIRITMFGRGGHGSRPETTIDPVVMAASTVLRLQTIVSREVAATETAVLTVGSVRAGTKANIIPDDAELMISIRTFDARVRDRVLAAVTRIVQGEAQIAGSTREPEIVPLERLPPVINDESASARATAVFGGLVGVARVVDPGIVTGSEDVGLFGSTAGAPTVFWLLGGADPRAFAGATTVEQVAQIVGDLPSNHSPLFALAIEPTVSTGVAALVTAAREWLPAQPQVS